MSPRMLVLVLLAAPWTVLGRPWACGGPYDCSGKENPLVGLLARVTEEECRAACSQEKACSHSTYNTELDGPYAATCYLLATCTAPRPGEGRWLSAPSSCTSPPSPRSLLSSSGLLPQPRIG